MAKKLSTLLLISAIVTGVLVWKHPVLLEQYALLFRKENATRGADAIVVLSSPKFQRAKRGLELAKANFAPLVLLTTTPSRRSMFGLEYPTKLEWVGAVAEHLQIAVPLKIVPSLKDGARSTFDEAYDVLHWSREHGYGHIIVVTNAFHSRRAHFAFEKVFAKSGIKVDISAAANPWFSESDWWFSDSGLLAYTTEPFKFLAYALFDTHPETIRND